MSRSAGAWSDNSRTASFRARSERNRLHRAVNLSEYEWQVAASGHVINVRRNNTKWKKAPYLTVFSPFSCGRPASRSRPLIDICRAVRAGCPVRPARRHATGASRTPCLQNATRFQIDSAFVCWNKGGIKGFALHVAFRRRMRCGPSGI